MTRDWNEDFALLAAAYPGRDPLSYTIAVFEARLVAAPMVLGYLHGFNHEAVQRNLSVDKSNREIIIRERAPNIFPSIV